MAMLLDRIFDRLLVISPHADDEVIGCGGLMKKVINNGGEVHVLVAAVGDIEFYHLGRVVTKEERKAELKNALDFLGVTSHRTLFDGYESLLDTLPIRELITNFESAIKEICPSAVLLPYPSFHQDHKAVFNAGFASLRPSPAYNKYLHLVAGYEYPFVSWASEQYLNNGSLYVDIAEELNDKIKALKLHKSQVRENKHLISPESIRLWAEKRGLEVNLSYAERYNVLRLLI